MLKFYDELPAMECFAGDTLPAFQIKPEGLQSLTGCSMDLLLESHALGVVALSKPCTLVEDTTLGQHFRVQLTTEDTDELVGDYRLHFIMTDSTNKEYEKLTGTLHVRPYVRAVSAE